MHSVAPFIIASRKKLGMTQAQLAAKAGVSPRFVIYLEQGKRQLRTDIVDKVLRLFGKELGPVEMNRELE